MLKLDKTYQSTIGHVSFNIDRAGNPGPVILPGPPVRAPPAPEPSVRKVIIQLLGDLLPFKYIFVLCMWFSISADFDCVWTTSCSQNC